MTAGPTQSRLDAIDVRTFDVPHLVALANAAEAEEPSGDDINDHSFESSD